MVSFIYNLSKWGWTLKDKMTATRLKSIMLIILSSTSFFLTYYSKIILTAPNYSQIILIKLAYYVPIILSKTSF